MNRPIRRVAVVVLLLLLALLVNVNWVQGFQAASLAQRPDNQRVRVAEYSRERGSILVGGEAVARSTPTDDALKYLRRYPGGAEYAPVTGYYSILYGSTGIERSQNASLAGTDSRLFVRRVVDLVQGVEPSGASVELTLRTSVQNAAWQGLAGLKGAVVALDPRTGAVLALASRPSFDPATLSSHDAAATMRAWTALNADVNRPAANRAARETYPPGSTFKLVTASAALATGRYQPATVVPAPDRLKLPLTNTYLNNDAGERCGSGGRTTLANALKISCNTAFGQLGLTLGNRVIADEAKKFGFGEQILPELNGVASVYSDNADRPQTASAAIGQFDDRATVVQMASVAATIANGGRRQEPYLVQRVLGPDLSTVSSHDAGQPRTVMGPQAAGQLTSMMEGVVTGGTGTAAQIRGVRVAGKTGTAQTGARNQGPTVAWFVAFAPADKPTVAVAVAVEDANLPAGTDAYGGRVAAPIARRVLQAALQ